MTTEFLDHKSNALLVDSIQAQQSIDAIKSYLSNKTLINSVASNARTSF